MATPRFCDACGAALVAGARFCEACGAALPQAKAPARAAPDGAPAPLPASRGPAATESPEAPAGVGSASPSPPSVKRHATGLLLALTALVLAGAIGAWYAVQPARMPERVAPAQDERRTPPAERPPARPAITRSEIDALKSAVEAANRAHVTAIFASDPPPLELRIRVDQAIGALGQALYRHHVEDRHGDIDTARQEMRSFLEGLDHDGLGLSAPAIDEGVASVAP